MLKYVSKLSTIDITKILQECSLRPVSFNNCPAIKITNKKLLVTCIKTNSLFYRTILDWHDKENEFGDMCVSYVDKDDFDNFASLMITDYCIQIINSNNILVPSNEELSIKLNETFLKTMIEKFKKTNYYNEFMEYSISNISKSNNI